MAITFECVCGKQLRASDKNAGRSFHCPSCGTDVIVPAPDGVDLGIATDFGPPPPAKEASPYQPPSAPIDPSRADYSTPAQRVIVTDFDMPFGSMVLFIIKWVLASIPAMLILWLLMVVLLGVGALVLGGLGMAFR